jgi:tetratricopeptide (TPR) repeat protein
MLKMNNRLFVSATWVVAAGMSLLAALAVPASAQVTAAATPACDIDVSLPRDLSGPYLQIQSALTGDTAKAVRLRAVKSVMERASANIASGQHMPLRNFIMAKAIFLALQIKDFPVQTTRGELGLTLSPSEPVDLIVALDSLLTTVEVSNPACEAETNVFRFTQLFVDMLQEATTLAQQEKLDSAEKIALRAQLLERKSPYTWQVLATVYTNKKEPVKAIEYWQKTYDAAKDDTTNTDIRLQALYFMGEANFGLSTTRQGAEAAASAREAARHFRQFLEEAPGHKDSPAARSNLISSLLAAGDTSAVPPVYKDLIDNPSKYTTQDHLQTGVSASAAGQNDDAIKLFGNAVQSAPFDRDALFNLSVSLFTAKKFLEMAPIAWRLVEVDPNNPENLQMLVYAYAMSDAAETDAARKAAIADSLQKFSPLYEKLEASHQVRYQQFRKDSTETSLSGAILNKGTAERSFRLEHEFLDKSGTVVDSQVITIGPVKPNEVASFTVKVDRGGISFFRAKPIPPPE